MRLHRLLLGAAALSLCFALQAKAQTGTIVGSPHDLTKIALPSGYTGYGGGTSVNPGYSSHASSYTEEQVCLPCHTPHNAGGPNNGDLLWNHTMSSATYTLYTSSTGGHVTANSGPGGSSYNPQLDSASLLCLSCHDGTVAIDSFGGNSNAAVTGTGGTLLLGDTSASWAVLGSNGNLSNTHPLGVGYPGLATGATVSNGVVVGTFTPTFGWNDPTYAGNPAFTTAGAIDAGNVAVNLVVTGNGVVGVGCVTCHEPHDYVAGADFLRTTMAGSQLCLKCHKK